MPDMKPVIGPAPDKAGLWLAFGHGHQGFTLGPATGELLAQMMDGEEPAVAMAPSRSTPSCRPSPPPPAPPKGPRFHLLLAAPWLGRVAPPGPRRPMIGG